MILAKKNSPFLMFGIHEVSMSISSALLKLESQILSYKQNTIFWPIIQNAQVNHSIHKYCKILSKIVP